MSLTETKKIKAFDKRIHEIDFARGLMMVLVILDHLFYLLKSYNKIWMGDHDLTLFSSLYNFFNFYWTSPIRSFVRYVVLMGFCFVSGLSCAFSRSNKKRAFQMVGLWAGVFIITNVLQIIYVKSGLRLGIDTIRIDFNIIGVLASSTALYCLFENSPNKNLIVLAGLGLIIHIIIKMLFLRNPNFGNRLYMPFFWEPSRDIAPQADYMPLVPYVSLFFLGAVVSKNTYAKDRKSFFRRYEFERPVCFLGRHSLIIYLSHFALFIGLFCLIDLFL